MPRQSLLILGLIELLGFSDQSLVAIISILVTLGGFIFVLIQIRLSQKVAFGELLLTIDQHLLEYHYKVHMRLRPGGVWDDRSNPGAGPQNIQDWIEVELYMGLFERVDLLVDRKILDITTVNRLYSYRIGNIIGNDIIRQAKLIDEVKGWQHFIKLASELGIIQNYSDIVTHLKKINIPVPEKSKKLKQSS